jgi:hypothetical protein
MSVEPMPSSPDDPSACSPSTLDDARRLIMIFDLTWVG